MRETHYIDIDEEIITAVSRLRQSAESEHVFVFPKRALILQSIVNLRLLDREAKKLGKKIIVMSQDEAGKKLAEKAGLVVEAYHDRPPLPSQEKMTPLLVPLTDPSALPKRPNTLLGSRSIGSESFFAHTSQSQESIVHQSLQPVHQMDAQPLLKPSAPSQPIRVRSADSVRLTSLNSMRNTAPAAPQTPPISQPLPPTPAPVFSPKKRLERFMANGQVSQVHPERPVINTSPLTQSKKISSSRNLSSFHWKYFGGFSLGLILLGAISFLGWYAFFPKAIVTIMPQSAEQVVRLQMSGVTNSPINNTDIPVHLIQLERSFQVTETASGTPTGTGAKAGGRIRIYNDFSRDSQPLVATTRFETSDGKIYRLTEGVTVPGVTEKDGKRERGMVEATVTADKAGSEYNIAPTRFTIPGLKGGPKYEKFSAESSQAFTGGGSVAGGEGQKTVSSEDRDRASKAAETQAREYILTEAKKELGPKEVIITDSLQLTKTSETLNPPLGGVAEAFVYEGRYTAKLFLIDEAQVRERIAQERVTVGEVTLAPAHFDVRYTALLPKYESGRLDMTIESTVLFQASLDRAKLEPLLRGQDETGIREFLKVHPEIERLQVEFDPQLFIKTIPNDPERLMIDIVQSEKKPD